MQLSQKYEPKTPDDLAGEPQRALAHSLLGKLEKGEVTQLLCIAGPSGSGKTSICKMYANALGAQYTHVNCVEIGTLDWVKEQFIPSLTLSPLFGEYNAYILDEVHGITSKSQEAMLVPLENLPPHNIILAATTEPDKVYSTLKSRLGMQRISVPSRKEISRLMLRVFKSEGVAVEGTLVIDAPIKTISKETAGSLIDHSAGNIRLLFNYMQQVIDDVFNPLETEENPTIAKMLLGGTSISELVGAVGKLSNPVGDAVVICKYAMRILSNPRSGAKEVKFALSILNHFGDGLSQFTSPDVSFCNKLLKVYKDLTNQ